VEFTNEVPFSEESFSVLTDAYRSFRNVARILLANAALGRLCETAGERNAAGQASDTDALQGATTLDRWMLSRLQRVIATCREAYEAYDFRKVFQTLNQFVAVDVSALYVDITKDRLYCDGSDSQRRRATQAVMAQVLDALLRLLAPILAFTADEAWEFAGKKTSVHLETFPQADASLIDTAAEGRVEKLLALRAVIAQAIEPARQAKQIGNALEASVTLTIADAELLKQLTGSETELEEFFIISELRLAEGTETKASVEPVSHKKCGRCWRHRPGVGLSAAHPDLCDRCEPVVAGK
jgi:isoleucyl-tRNA synthetase